MDAANGDSGEDAKQNVYKAFTTSLPQRNVGQRLVLVSPWKCCCLRVLSGTLVERTILPAFQKGKS